MRASTWLLFSMTIALQAGVLVAAEPYFPELVFDRRKERNDFVASWYSNHLKAMAEPSMWGMSRSNRESTGYRFLWLPTEGRPVAVRVREGAVLTLVQLDGAGGFDPGAVAIHKEVILSPERFEGLAAFVSRVRFWEMSTRDGPGGFDGEQLIVEGVKDGRYHIVDRWSPESGAFRRLCRHMIDLSGLDVERSWYETSHVTPSLGRFVVVVSGQVAIALRFVRHTGKGDAGSVYEWFMQEDGSADFTRPNVKVGAGEVFENHSGELPGDRRGQKEITCGPLVLRWSAAGESTDYLYMPSRRPRAISMTATGWTDRKEIDVKSPKLTWYHLAETH